MPNTEGSMNIERLTKFVRDLFHIHPTIPRSDIELMGFLVCALFSVLYAFGSTLEALGGKAVPAPLTLTLLFFIGSYSLHTITVYKIKINFNEKQRYRRKKSRVTVWRYGELFGFGLIIYLIVLVGLYVVGIVPHLPKESPFMVEALVGILVGTSLWKQMLDDEPRVRHNNLFLATALSVIAVQTIAFFIDAFGGRELPYQLMAMYLSVFLAHIAHDRALEIRCLDECEEEGLKRYADYIGVIVIFAAAVIWALYFITDSEIPDDLAWVAISTALIMFGAEWLKDRTISYLAAQKAKKASRAAETPETPSGNKTEAENEEPSE